MSVGQYVTSAGLQIPTVESLLADTEADQKATINPLLNTTPAQPIGQLNGIFCAHLRDAYEVVAIAYNGFNPDAAEGFLLDSTSAITGTIRAEATKSKLIGPRGVTFNMDANKTVPAGTVVHVNGDPTVRFVTINDVVSTTAGNYLADMECEKTGPVHANATTLEVIATPIVGLNSAINAFDAELGTDDESDPEERTRRELELRATGSGTVDSLRADLYAIVLDGVRNLMQSVTVLHNDQDEPDLTLGLTGHTLEAIVFDGISEDLPDNLIAQTIWNGKPAGITVQGTSSGTAIDTNKKDRTVAFTRATIKDVKFKYSVTVAPKGFAGVDACNTAIELYFADRDRPGKVRPGATIRCNDYVKALLTVPGVLDVTNMQLAFLADSYPASGVNLLLGIREMGSADTSNMDPTFTIDTSEDDS